MTHIERAGGEAAGFVTEVIDIEEYSKMGRLIPHGAHYRIRIDKTKYEVDVPSMTGRQILELASKVPPENYILRQIHAGGRPEKVALDKIVDFTTPGIEKFKTLPRDQTEG